MVRTVPTDRADSLAAIIADFCKKPPNPSYSRQIRESPCHDPNEPTCVAIMPQLLRCLHIIMDPGCAGRELGGIHNACASSTWFEARSDVGRRRQYRHCPTME